MSAIPTRELVPGSPGTPSHAEVKTRWLAESQPELVENMRAGWTYRAIRPDTAQTDPTFVLVVSSVQTDADHEGAPGGFTGAMATRQSARPGGRRELPIEPV